MDHSSQVILDDVCSWGVLRSSSEHPAARARPHNGMADDPNGSDRENTTGETRTRGYEHCLSGKVASERSQSTVFRRSCRRSRRPNVASRSYGNALGGRIHGAGRSRRGEGAPQQENDAKRVTEAVEICKLKSYQTA